MSAIASRKDIVAEQTSIRRALLRNGYSPFPCAGKSGQIDGWPDIKATEALIDEWAEQMRWVSTAVHTGVNGLVGIDVDIDDAAVLADFVERLPEALWDRLQYAPVRRGGGVKEMWLVRLAEGEVARRYKDTTGKWGNPESDADDADHKIEVWAKDRKLLALYGARTLEGRTATSWYSWVEDRGPHCVPVSDLPEITNEDVDVLLRCAVAAMQAHGWQRLDITEPTQAAERLFDLTSSMRFTTRDYGEVSLDELIDLCGALEEVRMYSWLPGKRRRADRCAAKLNDYDGLLQIYDHDTGTLHRIPEAEKAYREQVLSGVRSAFQRLRARLFSPSDAVNSIEGGTGESGDCDGDAGTGDDNYSGGDAAGAKTGIARMQTLLDSAPVDTRMFQESSVESGGAGPEVEDVEAARSAIVDMLLEQYAYWSDGRGFVVDVWKGPDAAMTFASFGVKLAPLAWEEKGKRGVKTINPVDLWKSDVRRLDVGGFRFLPTSRERLVKLDDSIFVNTWERPAWWDAVEGEVEADEATNSVAVAVDVFRRFLAHLVPDERERAWLTMWLAAKVQRPWLPNCGVVMVAERQGVGRGTLFDMLGGIFGSRHVRPVSAVELIGGGSQSQYTSWLENALLVTCDEVLAGDDAGGAMAWKRRDVYERLKALVDPRPRRVSIVRKGLPNNDADVFASFLLATNNINALPLSPDDRRFAVITNANVKLEDRLGAMAMLEPWRDENGGFGEAFCGAVGSWLRGVKVAWNEVRESPRWMVGRERMLQANESDLDGVLENVLRKVEGDFILGHHLRERVARGLEAAGLLHETKGWWSKTQDTLGRLNRFGWRKMDGRQKYAPKAKSDNVAVVFYREDGVGEKAWRQANGQERETLWAGGDPTLRKTNVDLGMKMQERGLRIVDDAG